MKYDCVIIGAGLSGLAAGIRLARFDRKVCICERHSRIGGLNSYYFRQGMLLESGLHAMTNFVESDAPKNMPLPKLLRQLQIDYDQLAPRRQRYSLIRFPEKSLRFNNDFSMLEDEIAAAFPEEIDRFRKLVDFIGKFNETDLKITFESTRKILRFYLKNSLLIDMLLCPLMYYGSAVPDDMNFAQFAIMFKSIYREGFCRPAQGIRGLLELLEEKYLKHGGTLKLNMPVKQIITAKNKAIGVLTQNDEIIECSRVISCAGAPETEILSGQPTKTPPGKMTFVETITEPEPHVDLRDLPTITFFCDKEQFDYHPSESLFSLDSGVICLPGNFELESGDYLPPRMVRATVAANFSKWQSLAIDEYAMEKSRAAAAICAKAGAVSGLRALDSPVNLLDVFTPLTIRRYTDRLNGAVYGSPVKHRQGMTDVQNLFLCGTDQGFLGITGALLSGISMANLHLLK